MFERRGARWVVYWHTFGEGALTLNVDDPALEVRRELYEEPAAIERGAGFVRLPAGDRRYIRSSLTADQLKAAFDRAVLD